MHIKKLGNCLLANTQPVGHLPTAITKGGLSHGKSNIATIKYHRIHAQWKVFDDGYSFPTKKGLNKKLGNCLLANTQPVGHLPTAITKGGLYYGKSNIATIKNHWIHVQWKVFDGGFSFPTKKGLNKYLGNCLLANTQLVGHLPTEITKGGLSNGKSNRATIKYHWTHVQ